MARPAAVALALAPDTARELAIRGRRNSDILRILLAGLGAIAAAGLIDPEPRLIWNVSESAPKGLYWTGPGSRPAAGEYAAARLPPAIQKLAADRRYLPLGLPVVKRVAAIPGDEICASNEAVTLFGKLIARRRKSDPAGRKMPWWTGCRRLGGGEYLLINPANPLSFDGRYFGPTPASDMIGGAKLIWRS